MKENVTPFLKWALIVSIIIVINLFVNYTLSLLYQEPDYIYNPTMKPLQDGFQYTEVTCADIGGQWNSTPYLVDGETKGYCDTEYTNRTLYEEARKVYERNIFLIMISIGVLMLGIGMIVRNEVVVIALSWSGVFSFIIASMRYWSSAENIIRVAILGIALFVLLWMSIKKFSK
jgi:hypothetical protein